MTSLRHDRLVQQAVDLGFSRASSRPVIRALERCVDDQLHRQPDAWRVTKAPSGRLWLELVECDVTAVTDYSRLADYARFWFALDAVFDEADLNWDIALWVMEVGEVNFVSLVDATHLHRKKRDLTGVFTKVPAPGVYPPGFLREWEAPGWETPEMLVTLPVAGECALPRPSQDERTDQELVP